MRPKIKFENDAEWKELRRKATENAEKMEAIIKVGDLTDEEYIYSMLLGLSRAIARRCDEIDEVDTTFLELTDLIDLEASAEFARLDYLRYMGYIDGIRKHGVDFPVRKKEEEQ